MKYMVAKIGVFSVGLVGGILATFLFLGITFAAGQNLQSYIGRPEIGFISQSHPAAVGNNNIAGPPPLALRLNAQQNSGGSNQTFLPLILKN